MSIADAPHGPVARYFARIARAIALGDEIQNGGLLGFEVGSPRLRGHFEKMGLDTAHVSRLVDNATRWATAEPTDLRLEANTRTKQENARRRYALAPLFEAVHSMSVLAGRHMTKNMLLTETHNGLMDPYGYYEEDDEAREIALDILDSGVLGRPLPSFSQFDHWFRKSKIDDMLNPPHPDRGR